MFTQMETAGIAENHLYHDHATGLRAIIAIHSTRLGPAIGGCRFIPYDHESDAIADAMRLAKGMSYKAALAGLPHGGGKSVIIKPEGAMDRTALMQAFGRFIDTLQGRYITAMDSGTLTSDMDAIATSTPWVTCTTTFGDPGPFTARGVVRGMMAAVEHRLGTQTLAGMHVAIQGLGNVGMAVAQLLHQHGARLTVTDINPALVASAASRFGAATVMPDAIYSVAADIFCPCGLGGVLNPTTIDALNVSVVAGSANNQLTSTAAGEQLHDKGILYAPDYVINAGGLIYVALKHTHTPQEAISAQTDAIQETLSALFTDAETAGQAPFLIADAKAEQVIAKGLATEPTRAFA
ncbi:amino acid dehydrogenase [Neptunomonas sp. XY-337]|uniref:Leu/Phe/Val dehydrogenase n=1 Tax=Neptunomonas sp. XY-337 TaxID=2561897 RepID=UPI0010AA5ED1|nr:amino acid dehydrogenase [Neptunomonas sp. XY-337]